LPNTKKYLNFLWLCSSSFQQWTNNFWYFQNYADDENRLMGDLALMLYNNVALPNDGNDNNGDEEMSEDAGDQEPMDAQPLVDDQEVAVVQNLAPVPVAVLVAAAAKPSRRCSQRLSERRRKASLQETPLLSRRRSSRQASKVATERINYCFTAKWVVWDRFCPTP
jgi:hypothetical protein